MSKISNALAERAAAPAATVTSFVERMMPEIQAALPKGMDAQRVARLVLTVIRASEIAKAKGTASTSLSDCTPESFAGALLTACALGLEPGVDGEAWLVPYGRECTFILGYKGYAKLFWQHPLAKHLAAEAVYERDEFDYGLGLEPWLTHKPARGDRGEPIAFYAVAALTTGAKHFVVLTPEEVAKLRGSRAAKRRNEIADPLLWMSRKTALRQLFHLVPRSTQMSQAIAADEQGGTVLSSTHTVEQIVDGVVPEFAPAIEAEATEPDAVRVDSTPSASGAKLRSDMQSKKLWALAAATGVTDKDRDEFLLWISGELGRAEDNPVASTSELTVDEASKIIGALDRALKAQAATPTSPNVPATGEVPAEVDGPMFPKGDRS